MVAGRVVRRMSPAFELSNKHFDDKRQDRTALSSHHLNYVHALLGSPITLRGIILLLHLHVTPALTPSTLTFHLVNHMVQTLAVFHF